MSYRFRLGKFNPGDCAICDGEIGDTKGFMFDGRETRAICQSCLQQVRAAEKYGTKRMLVEIAGTRRRIACLFVARHGLEKFLASKV